MEGVTRKSVNLTIISLALILVLLSVTVPFAASKPAYADYPPSILKWSFVNTPTIDGFVVVPQSEINRIAFGPDDQAMYAVDVANSPNNVLIPVPTGRCLYKSTDKGVTWDDITNRLPATSLPVWDIVVSPDDANFVVAITDIVDPPLPNVDGPQAVFVSTDGGQTWQNTDLKIAVGPPGLNELRPDEYISCVAISPQYDIDKRYIAIATRDSNAVWVGGRVFTFKAPGFSGWVDQTNAFSPNWVPGDVVALKFSPSYALDAAIVIVYASPVDLFLNIGSHDVIANRTTWKSGLGYPVMIRASDNRSPDRSQIITADLELPFDFSGSDPGTLRRYFVSFDARDGATYFSGIYRVDNNLLFQLMYSTVVPPAIPEQRISSIAYYGTYASGKLIAGETTTEVNRGTVDIWLCSDPFALAVPPGWRISSAMKSPTGGGTSGRANALVHWDARGDKVYCGTSSANLMMGGTLLAATQWPGGLLTGSVPPVFDESAFSVSRDNGEIWNQISLIDTSVNRLTDVAVIEAPEDSDDHSVLYLASINDSGATNFDSIWRSVSDPLGLRWERVLCPLITNNANGIILRFNPRISEDNVRSTVIMFAEPNTDNIRYSANEGQYWQILYPGIAITDFTLASDTVIYILSDIFVMRGNREGSVWKWGVREPTGLTTGHTITTPLKNPPGRRGLIEDWVIVGSTLVGEVAYADFSKIPVKFLPPVDERKRTPVPGDVHVLADEQFEANRTIYVAIGNAGNGKIYRWIMGKSTDWEELQPINSDFRGVVQRRAVLYGAYDVPTPPNLIRGVDRTLYPRVPVPPPPEWDDLTANLPGTVSFNREPSSLRISGRADNNLWAIDNNGFNWTLQQGLLWVYTDTLAKSGPWTTAPASEDVIPVDPVTGRANEVNFAWRSLSYAQGYELQIAKDQDFFLRVLVNTNVVPPDQVSPAWIQFPGLLEAGHKYFWRVRASRASTGEVIHSPWSAIMNFTAMAGFPVQAKHLGPTLLQPPNPCTVCNPVPAFSWSPMFQTTKYQFILARDAALTQVVHEAEVSTTAYEYKETLEKGTYFWQVKAIKPMLSEPSPVGCFIVTGPEKTTSVLGVEISESMSLVITIGIALYTIFVAVMLVWIMRTRYRGE